MNMVGIETYHFNCLSVANNLLSNPPPPLSMICAVGPSLFTAYAETRYYPSGDQLRQRTLVVPPHCLKGCVISLSSVNCSPYPSRSMWGYVLPYRGLLLTPSPRYDGTLPPRSRFWAFQNNSVVNTTRGKVLAVRWPWEIQNIAIMARNVHTAPLFMVIRIMITICLHRSLSFLAVQIH